MTLILPKKNILDKILTLLGKERLPDMKGVGDIFQRLGKYAIIRIRYESFFKALFRKNK
jgi:hypothetical protein